MNGRSTLSPALAVGLPRKTAVGQNHRQCWRMTALTECYQWKSTAGVRGNALHPYFPSPARSFRISRRGIEA